MTTRSGWKRDGKHFTQTETTRVGSPRTMYFIDGKPTPHREWYAAWKAADAADKALEAES